jgi:ABC-type nitrate/sulfonate/bicarbonate transport system substrate-binding protein
MSRSLAVTRRNFITTIGAGAAASAIGFSFPRPAIAQLAKVSYTLSWLPTGQYAFLYAARQLGYFKARGIDLDISRGYGSMAATQAVATAKFDMGGAQTGANLLSMMRGLDLRLLGTQGYDATLGILVLEKGPIKSPQDLEGKKIGVSAAGGDTPFLPAYCKLAGVDFGKITVVQLDSKILEQSAMSGVVDAIVATGLSSIPNFVSEDVPIRMLPFSKVGLQFYWLNTIASPSFYEKNKEVADNVQAGIVDGMKFMLTNPQEAMERHMKEHEELALGKNGKLYVELGMGMTRAIMMAPESIEHGLGYTDLSKLDEQVKVVKQYTGKAGDRDLPKVETFVSNTSMVTLTEAEWQEVKASTRKYAKLLGQA